MPKADSVHSTPPLATSSTQLSRRTMMAALVAGAAADLPAVTAAAAQPLDPIFPLIEAYKAARMKKLSAYEAIAVFEETHFELLYREPVDEADAQELEQLKDAAGITVAETIEDRAYVEQRATLEAVMRQVPTTWHGLAAYVAVAASQDFTDHDRTAISVMASALQALADAARIL
jgi:hypothetical protein